MLSYILKRLLSGLVLLFVVASGTFFLAHAAIPNPALGLLGSGATPEAIASLTAKIGADRPVLVQYQEWLVHIIQGDFGVSWKNQQPIGKMLALRLPVTLSLVTASVALSAVLGAVLGLALLSVVTSSLILLDVSPYWQDVIKGLILLAAVTIDHIMNTRKTKR